MERRFARALLTLGAVLVAIAVWFTGTIRAGDNLDFQSEGVIRDMFWDSRLFDGTPGFPGAIPWHHNPTGMPGGLSRTEFEARMEAGFNAWDAVDADMPEAPLVPIVNLGGQTSVTDAFALDGVNAVTWGAEGAGGTLATTPCWVLTEPTTTIDDGAGHTVMPVSGGSPIPFPGPIGVTYPTGAIIDCGMRFDSQDSWSTTEVPSPSSFDVQAIATHEGGHFIGISHSTLGDFTGASTTSATMLPFAVAGDSTFRTLEEDDKASVLRIYARNRAWGPIAQTAGGRGVIQFTLLKGAACQPATGLSVVAYRTSTGIAGPGRVETFSGSHLRAGVLDEPVNGSVTLNVLPLPAGESYTIYARTFEQGLGTLSSQRYNYTTVNSNLVDPQDHSRTFDQLARIEAIGSGESIDLGSIGILGCWAPNPGSSIDLISESITAPATAFNGGQIAVTSSFRNQGSAASGPFTVGVYFSADQTINTDDAFTGFTCSVPDLLPGAIGTCNGLVGIPSLVPGDYYVGLLADVQNQVTETVESNNGVRAGNLTTVATNPLDPIVNGSFETGDLTGWTVKELTPASNPNLPLSVRGAGVEYPAPTFVAFPYVLDYFTSAPTDGQWAVLHDFNGNDPATSGFVNRRELYQDITLPPGTTTVEFDYRAAWELFRFGSTRERTFTVEIEPAGGGSALLTQTILVAPNATIEEDTDNPTGGVGDYPPGSVDLSAFGGQVVRLKFVWNIPEPGKGFGFFQLDNIRLNTAANDAPAVTVTEPADQSTFAAGAPILFMASASDTEDGDISTNLSWSSSLDGPIGSGASFSTSALSVGTHTISASVTDSGSASGSDSIEVTVTAAPNTAPTVTITAPANGSAFLAGSSIAFAGSASDIQDGTLSASLSWSSSVDGSIGSGASFSTGGLSVGTHTISASVTDSGSASGSASISVTVNPVPNSDVVNLATSDASTARGTVAGGTSFEDTWAEDDNYEILTEARQGGGASARSRLEHTWTFAVAAGTQYIFTVGAFHDGTEDDFVFSYSRDNVTFTPMVIATGTTDSDTPQAYLFQEDVRGTVYVRVEDTDMTRGNSQLDSLFVDFLAITTTANGTTPMAPVVVIATPSDGLVFTAGTAVSFTGGASDADDGNLAGNLQWTSSLDGAIGSGASFSTSALSVGAHTITASVTDSDGMQGTDSISLTVIAGQSLTLSAVGYKVKGVRYTDLAWSGGTTGVIINRNGQQIATGSSAGEFTDNIGGKGAGSFTYQVCETGGGSCSNVVTVTF